jgi:hypothetical protein
MRGPPGPCTKYISNAVYPHTQKNARYTTEPAPRVYITSIIKLMKKEQQNEGRYQRVFPHRGNHRNSAYSVPPISSQIIHTKAPWTVETHGFNNPEELPDDRFGASISPHRIIVDEP